MITEVKNKRYVVTHDTGVVNEYDRAHVERLRESSELRCKDFGAEAKHYGDLLKEMDGNVG